MNVYYPSGWKGKPSKRGVRSPKGSRMKMAPAADLIILFCADAAEWDQYLTCCFLQSNSSIVIEHEQLENLQFPVHSTKAQRFTQAKAVLVVISPDFLDFIDTHAKEVFEVGKLLKPTQTVAMLCGIQENDITCFHKAALVTYDDWPRLVARDQDKGFVISIIRQTEQVLIRSLERQASTKTMFKLSPKKVREGSAKVFVILDKPLTEWQKVQIHLEGNGVREVQAKKKNPYTLQFVVPDNCLQSSKIVNVHVKCDDQLLGIRQLRCDSKMGELYSLLSSVNSPYELLCHVSGVSALHEVDMWLVNNFRHNLPGYGFSLFDPVHESEKKKSDEELPTLLHFAARYGLHELTSQLLQCPGASQACHLRNARGLSPAQLANISGHNDIASMLEDFQKYMEFEQNQDDKSKAKVLDAIHEPWNDSLNALYSIPRNTPLPVAPQVNTQSDHVDSDYMPMFECSHKDKVADNLKPLEDNLAVSETDAKSLNGKEESEPDVLNDQTSQNHNLCESQKELIKIMELYKQGFSYTEVERKFHEWQVRYQDSSKESADALNILRDMYKSVHRKPERKRSFTFSELRSFFNSFLGSKENSRGKSLSHKSFRRLQDKHQDGDSSWRISIASSSSTNSTSSSASCDRISTVSISTCDSGTHSDSYDEVTHSKKRIHQNAKVQNVVKKSEESNSLKTDLPPPPPPRPPKLPVNRGIENKQPNVNHSYYQFPQQTQGVTATDYVMADTICYTTAASEEDISQDKLSSTTSNESLSVQLEGILDETNDYDCVPVPVPISSVKTHRRKTVSGANIHKLASKVIRRRNSSSTSDLSSFPVSKNYKHQSNFDDYYDIPAFPLPVTKEKLIWKVSSQNKHQCSQSVSKLGNESLVSNGKFSSIDISADYSIPRPHIPNSCSDPSLSNSRATREICDDSCSDSAYYNICFRSSNSDSQANCNETKHDVPDEVAPPPPLSPALKEEEYYKVISVSRPVLPRTVSKYNEDSKSNVPTALKQDLQAQKVKNLVKMFS